MEKKKILICGAGSIGIYMGVMLHLQNHEVKLVGRKKLHETKERVIINRKEYDIPEKLHRIPKNYKADVVFITTKLYDFDKMINLIKKSRIKYSKIAAIQNGIINLAEGSRILKHKITPLVVFSGFNLVKGEIIVKPTKIGWITENSQNGKEISKILLDAGIPCKSRKDFNSLRAEKMIVNCCLNALSAIENKPFCDLFKEKKTREKISELFDEAYNILENECPLRNPEKMKKEMFQTWSKLKHYSSTHQDVKSGRMNEVDFLNGKIIELGRKYFLPTENNELIVKKIKTK